MDIVSDAMQAVMDAVAAGDPILAAVAGVMVIGLVVLKLLKKSVPILDPILSVILGVVKKIRAPKESPKEEGGLADVVPIKEIEKPKSEGE